MTEQLVEHRFAAPVEFREGGTGPGTVSGVAVRYGDEAQLPGFRERFQAGAFGDLGDVILNVQHERSRPLARTGGGGLVLTDSPSTLRAVVDLPPTRDGEDVAELLRRGVLAGFSLEFRVEGKGERFDAAIRVVSHAKLLGLALVDRPAYGDSVAAIAKRARQRSAFAHGLRVIGGGPRTIWL